MFEAPISIGAIKLRNVLDCQAKMLETVMDRRHLVCRHNIHDIEIVSFATQWLFGVISLALPTRVKTAYNGSFGGRGNKARLSISFPVE
jgi:hypothetical protein